MKAVKGWFGYGGKKDKDKEEKKELSDDIPDDSELEKEGFDPE